MADSDKYAAIRKYTPDQLDMAKKMFMAYKSRKEICEATGIAVNTFPDYAKKWIPERDLLKSEMFSALADSKKRFFVDLAQNGLELLVRSIKDLNRSGETLAPRELKEIAAIITEIDKIIRLDDGKPTEIVESLKPATRESIIELLKTDPFNEIEDAEFKDV